MKNNSRYIAWELLKKVIINNSFSNILLNEVSEKEIDEKFKNLIFAIVHGTIANKIYLQYLTSKIIDSNKTPIEIQIILWMSLYQINFLKSIPQYAILNEAVNIAKSFNPKFSGFINACLKKVINDKDFFEINTGDEKFDFCIKNSFPPKLYKKIKNDYSEEIAKKIVLDSMNKPNISFRVNTLKISTNDFFNQYEIEFGLKQTSTKDCLISSKPIVKSEMYKKGLITIQDEASIMVGNLVNPNKDSMVLDMCSAPGGKLTHLAAIMNNTGSILGNEISENKMSLIKQNMERLGVLNVNLINKDGREISEKSRFDYILLDAPCSGFGVLKRKPEIKNNLNLKAVNEIVILQSELLDSAYNNLKQNGTLVYSTCTINADENIKQISKFIEKYPNMEIVSQKQIFGFENNTDGFFMCKLIKK